MSQPSPLAEPVRSLLRQVHALYAINTVESVRAALGSARKALKLAAPDSAEAIWAHYHVAACSGDRHHLIECEYNARAYLRLLPAHTHARAALPWVLFALATCQRHTGHRRAAYRLMLQALALAEGALAERLRLSMVWLLCEMGRLRAAKRLLPERLEYLPEAQLCAASVRLLTLTGEWRLAHRQMQRILPAIASASVYDRVQYAFLCYVLQHGLREARHAESARWGRRAASIVCLWRVEAARAILSQLCNERGEKREDATSPSGPRPAGYKRTGLLGTVGKRLFWSVNWPWPGTTIGLLSNHSAIARAYRKQQPDRCPVHTCPAPDAVRRGVRALVCA